MLKKFRNSRKKGFTLVEVIVVLVILAILIALAVPTVMKYIDDANDIKDDIKVKYLNDATDGYRVYMYAEDHWKKGEDLFAGVTTNKNRQKILIDSEWLDEYQTSIYDGNDYFVWNVEKQIWVRKGQSGDMSEEEKKENDTIIGDIDKGNDRGEWEKNGIYKYGDIVEVNGVFYKCVYKPKENSIQSTYGPVGSNSARDSFWKEIDLNFSSSNNYETGDIIIYKSEYYKATGFDSSQNYMSYYNAANTLIYDSAIIRELFTKVVWQNGEFVPAN